MNKDFKEMFLYNEDNMLGAERVCKYIKIKISNTSIINYWPFYYDPLFNGGTNGLRHILYGSFSAVKNKYKPHEKIDKPLARYKTGIDILGMKPRRTKDGKV
jgi:hypothetical protein